MEKWRGKVAIVTGASAGVGVDIVKQLVEEGVIVCIELQINYIIKQPIRSHKLLITSKNDIYI